MSVDPGDLSTWALHGFSPNARRTPHPILALDNNGAILTTARDWITIEAVRGLAGPLEGAD